jgi:hypothetical protein
MQSGEVDKQLICEIKAFVKSKFGGNLFILSTVNNCVFYGSNFRDDCRDAKFCVSTDTPINDGGEYKQAIIR